MREACKRIVSNIGRLGVSCRTSFTSRFSSIRTVCERPEIGLYVTCLLLFVLLSCRASRKVSETSVRVGVLTNLTEMFPVSLPNTLGYFREQRLSVTIDEYSSGPKSVESLVGGSSDVSCNDYVNPLVMAAQGRRLKTFILITTAPSVLLVVSPAKADRIRRVEDLKGAVVGLAGFGSTHQRLVEYLASKHGLASGDIQVTAYGTGPSAIATLEHTRWTRV